MRARFLAGLLAVCLCATAVRGEGLLQSLENGFAARPWQAVGRLDIDGRGFCSAVLVAEDLVLTAAHCLFDRQSGQRFDLARMEFRAGWRRGRAVASRGLRRAAVHPGYAPAAGFSMDRVASDLALLALTQPITPADILPFAIGQPPRQGTEVGVVSYARGREAAPALEEACNVLAAEGGILFTTCQVGPGASGAPIFRLDSGEPRLVALVSAMAEVDGLSVALSVALRQGALDDLRAVLAAAPVPTRPSSGTGPMRSGEDRRISGARFVRPPDR